jgi:hypothetical protein
MAGNGVTVQVRAIEARHAGLRRRIGWFVDQTRKTIRRPSRLFFISFGYLLLSRWSDIALLVMRLIPKRLSGRSAWNELNFIAGHQLLQLNRPEEAWQYLEQCLRDQGDPHHLFLGAVCLYHGLGRFADAQALLRRANDIRGRQARELGVADFRGRVLDEIWTAHIGHTATLDFCSSRSGHC